MIARTLRWLIATALAVVGAAFAVVPATAAGAGYCTGSGVNVVVDSGALGAGVLKGCGQGSVAHPVFDSAGFTLSEIHTGGMTGFVCTVAINGTQWPSNGRCTGANGDGYWALFVASPGKPWVYASLGADSQPVSNGQTVAFAWQAPGGGERSPAVAPATISTTPKPKPQPTTSVTARSAAAPSGVSRTRAAAHPTTTVSASATSKPTKVATPSPSATASASTWSLTAPSPSSTAKGSSSNGGLPWWIPISVVVLLAIGAAGTWWRKRAGS